MEQNITRRERKKQETRERILSVAREMLISRGYGATTLEEIAETADVAKATFYNYFPNKDDLLRQIAAIEVEAVDLQMAQETDRHSSPLAAICRSQELTFSESSPVLQVIRRILLEDIMHPEKIPLPLIEKGNMLIDLVRQSQEQGELRSDLDPTQTAQAIGRAYLAASIFCKHLNLCPESPQNDYSLTLSAMALLESVGITRQTEKGL